MTTSSRARRQPEQPPENGMSAVQCPRCKELTPSAYAHCAHCNWELAMKYIPPENLLAGPDADMPLPAEEPVEHDPAPEGVDLTSGLGLPDVPDDAPIDEGLDSLGPPPDPVEPAAFPAPPTRRGRRAADAREEPQAQMGEKEISHAELPPLLKRIAQLEDDLEEDEETAKQRKELRQARKRVKQIVTDQEVVDGTYRVSGTGWLLDVNNQPGGSKTIDFGASVKVKIRSVE